MSAVVAVMGPSQDAPAIPSASRRNNLDLVRMVLAMTVVLYHLSFLSQAPTLHFLQEWLSGTFAVQGFFAVSGFLIFQSFEQSATLADYASRRIRRIFPAYFAALALGMVLAATASTWSLQSFLTSQGLRAYVENNAVFLNFRAPYLPGAFESQFSRAVNGSLWTIKIELMFYLAAPLLVLGARRFGAWRVLGSCYVASVAYRLAIAYGLSATPDVIDRLGKQFPGELAYFAAGCLVYCWWRDGRRLPWTAALLATTTYLLLSGTGAPAYVLQPVAVGIMVLFAGRFAPYLGPFGRFGDFSYGIYVYHFPIIQTAIALGAFTLTPLRDAVVVVAIVLMSGVASWWLIERRWLRTRRPVPAQASA